MMRKLGSPCRRPSELDTALIQRGVLGVSDGGQLISTEGFRSAPKPFEVLSCHPHGSNPKFRKDLPFFTAITLDSGPPAKAKATSNLSRRDSRSSRTLFGSEENRGRGPYPDSDRAQILQIFSPKTRSVYVYFNTSESIWICMASKGKNAAEIIRELHQAYQAKQLNVLVGAGVSRPSGMPTWDELNKKLLHLFLLRVQKSSTPPDDVYTKLGREAVAEFVLRSMEARRNLGRQGPTFGGLLAEALYGGRKATELPLTETQYRLASMAGVARLYTTNFDSLLEMAIDRLSPAKTPGDGWKKYRMPISGTETLPHKSILAKCVYHLHGWLGENGRTSPTLVFTESHYHALSLNRTLAPARMMRKVLAKGYTLILGMSLEDPNLRRVLYSEAIADLKLPNSDNIFAVVRESDEDVARIAQRYWSTHGVRLIQPDRFEEIPILLRQVQFGNEREDGLLPWVPKALAWLSAFTRLDRLRDPDVRANLGDHMMRLLVSELRSRFEVNKDEAVEATFFSLMEAPFSDPRVRQRIGLYDVGTSESLTADSLPPRLRKSAAEILKDRCRFLALAPRAQGVGGMCFESGITLTTTSTGAEVDRRFLPWQREAFDLQRPFLGWKTVVSIPIVHGPQHLPIGVVCLTSNSEHPFWKRAMSDPDQDLAFRQAVDTAALSLLSEV